MSYVYYISNPSPSTSSIVEFANGKFGLVNDAAPCHISPPWQQNLQFKLAGVYTVPWGKLRVSENEQNIPSIPLQASYSFTASSVTYKFSTNPALNPNGQTKLSGNPASTYVQEVVAPQSIFPFGPNNQFDIRFARDFSIKERFKIEPTIDLYNVFNASPILSTEYGYNANTPGTTGAYRNVTGVLPARLLKWGVHVEF